MRTIIFCCLSMLLISCSNTSFRASKENQTSFTRVNNHPAWFIQVDSDSTLSARYIYCTDKLETLKRLPKDSVDALIKYAETNLPEGAADNIKSKIYTRY